MTDAFQEDYEDLDVNRRGLRVREAWPLVFAGPRPVVNYDAYPVEALCIMPHQRVPESQMPEDLDRMIKVRCRHVVNGTDARKCPFSLRKTIWDGCGAKVS